MSSQLIDAVVQKAATLGKTIVLPDSADERAVQAARILADQGIAHPVLVGEPAGITRAAQKASVPLEGIETVNPAASPLLPEFAREFHDLRKAKGITPAEAEAQMRHPLFFGAMMVRKGLADGSVAGSLSTTGDVLRAGIQVIGLADGISVVSSFFLMVFPHILLWADPVFIHHLLMDQDRRMGAHGEGDRIRWT